MANKVWVGRNLHDLRAGHRDFAHGHQGHELESGRYAFDPLAWPDLGAARARTQEAFDRWEAIGNSAGPRNYPGTDDDQVNPPPNGLPWHSSVDWREVDYGQEHEVLIEYTADLLGPNDLALFIVGGPHNQHIHVKPRNNWGFDTGNAGAVYDFASVILHEAGHVIGFDHFGSLAEGQIMSGEPMPLRNQPNGILRTIDPEAAHGVRDLYAIPGIPEPATLTLLGAGALLALRRRLRRAGADPQRPE